MKNTIFLSLLFSVCGLCGLQAQTVEPANPEEADTAVAEQGTTIFMTRENNREEHQLPDEITKLTHTNRFKEAQTEYAKYRNSLKDNYEIIFSDKLFYQDMKEGDPNNASYKAAYDEAVKKLRASYPNKIEVILIEIEELGNNATSKDLVRVYTKVLAIDSTYTDAYLDRGMILMGMNETKKACLDFSKLPQFKELPWYEECANLLGLPIEKPAETEEE